MRRIIHLILFLLLLNVEAHSQIIDTYSRYLAPQASDPSCTQPGQQYFNTSVLKMKVCTVAGSPGTWVLSSSAGAGGTINTVAKFTDTTGTVSNSTITSTGTHDASSVDFQATAFGANTAPGATGTVSATGLISSTLSTGTVLSLGNHTGTSTATPAVIDMGATFSSAAGANPKLHLYDDGTTFYGMGVSSGQLDYTAPAGGSHAFYIAGTRYAQVTTSGVQATAFGANTAPGAAGTLTFSNGTILQDEGANQLTLKNGINAQTFRFYNTYTDANNWERTAVGWSANTFLVTTNQLGTGLARDLTLGTNGASNINFQTNAGQRFQISSAGHFLASADNVSDVGASGASRPRTGYFGTSLVAPRFVSSSNLAPTLAGTGFGTSPSITLDTGSSDFDGGVTVTTGTTPGASGTLTITFSTGSGAYGANSAHCGATLKNGTVSWNARATAILGAESTLSAVVNWDNNAVALGAGTVKFNYHCPAN